MSEWIQTETYIPETTDLECGECSELIYTCTDCGNYFEPGEIIHCNCEDHLCETCHVARIEIQE